MKKTAKLIEKLIRLANGDALPASSLKGAWFEQMQNDASFWLRHTVAARVLGRQTE